MTRPALIGIDWGSTNLRAYRLGDGGVVIDQRSDDRGARGLEPRGFASVLVSVVGDWMAEGHPVLICGMAGARDGWREAPYRNCPTSAPSVAQGLTRVGDGVDIWIIPGVACVRDGLLVDVMRGEETQVFGAAGDHGRGVIVAPGTHSKWIGVKGGVIESFKTFPTGELFEALRASPLLGNRLSRMGTDPAAFDAGVDRGLTEPELSSTLFSVRVERLAGRLSEAAAADYLSGLLIGSEVAVAKRSFDSEGAPIHIVGGSDLSQRYGRVITRAKMPEVRIADGTTVTALGLWRIWNCR